MSVPPRSGSVASARSRMSVVSQGKDILSGNVSIYKGVSNRPLGWKPRKQIAETVSQVARDANLKKFDGAGRRSLVWDGLRRDPELWFPDGDCLVHLYGRGQSRRGPAFKIPFSALIRGRCQPLLSRFLVSSYNGSPVSDSGSNEDSYFSHSKACQQELYIPAPPTMDRNQAMMFHIATRNFFAWLMGRSLAGSHLSTALVALLHSMNEFRSHDTDNVQDLLDFMDEEGYADLRSTPSHALSVLHFAERFQFKDLYIDAFAHCVGMNERLDDCAEFELTSTESKNLIRKARTEMDARLSRCGKSLSTFLENELSQSHHELSSGARAHLDRFRAFLQAYYVAKLGYYPPSSAGTRGHAFPQEVFALMLKDFQMLFDFLVDESWTFTNSVDDSSQGEVHVLDNIAAFDERHHYTTLETPLPLLPNADADVPVRSRSRLSFFGKADKLKLDPRLVALSSMNKATNRQRFELLESSFVRAYKDFEKDCIFSTARVDRSQQISSADARKVRWILIYGILQTLKSTAAIPKEVRDSDNINYNVCVSTVGCPPFDSAPLHTLIRSQSQYTQEGSEYSSGYYTAPGTPVQGMSSNNFGSRDPVDRTRSAQSMMVGHRGNVHRAVSSLGNMPELKHPRPQRNSFHEILISGYGNGNTVSGGSTTISSGKPAAPVLHVKTTESPVHKRDNSIDSGISDSGLSSRWSRSSDTSDGGHSSASSVSDSPYNRRDSIMSVGKSSIRDILINPFQTLVRSASNYSEIHKAVPQSDAHLQPQPLSVRKSIQADNLAMTVTQEVQVSYESVEDLSKLNPELDAYLAS